MARIQERISADPLTPARNQAEWDAQGWASTPQDLSVAPRLETTISIRFDAESAALLRRAARIKGQTKSEFVRQATLKEARNVIAENPLKASIWIVDHGESRATTQGSRQAKCVLVSSTGKQSDAETSTALELVVR